MTPAEVRGFVNVFVTKLSDFYYHYHAFKFDLKITLPSAVTGFGFLLCISTD